MQKKFVAVTLMFIILINTIYPEVIYAKEMFAATYTVVAANEQPDTRAYQGRHHKGSTSASYGCTPRPR